MIPEVIRTIPHVAFEVDDLDAALEGQQVIYPPGSPSEGARSAMILHNGAPVELIWFRKPEPAPTGANAPTAAPGGSVSHDPSEDGLLKAVADSKGSLTVLGPCLPAQAETEYEFSARLRGDGTARRCSLDVLEYSDGRCSQGEKPLGSSSGPPGDSWGNFGGSASTSSAKSVQVRVACSGQPKFVVHFDDFVLAKGAT